MHPEKIKITLVIYSGLKDFNADNRGLKIEQNIDDSGKTRQMPWLIRGLTGYTCHSPAVFFHIAVLTSWKTELSHVY